MNIAYAGKLVLIGCGIGLYCDVFIWHLPSTNDCLAVLTILFLPSLALGRWLRGDKV